MNDVKLNGESLDIVQDNIEKLKELFPEIITENKIDFDKLKIILGENIEESINRYNFTWSKKIKAMKEAEIQSKCTLRPCKENSKNWDNTDNIYIEGDNLEVLKLLQKSYYNKIKAIYIDPPYNTGKDFIYNDDYVEDSETYLKSSGQKSTKNRKGLTSNPETDGRFHTNWLNMMYPRLKLARNLLTADGLIFISIDDNEQENLKKICDEIFGSNNFLLTMCVNRTSEIASNYTVFKHEYLLVYVKNINEFKLETVEKFTISRGTVGNSNQTMPIIEFPAGLDCRDIPDGIYEETRKIDGSSENIENFDPIIIENGKLKAPVRLKARWRSSNDMRNFFENDCKPTPAKINGEIVEIYFENNRFNPQIKKKTYEKIPSLFLDNKKGSNDLNKLGLKNYFKFPKSVHYLKYILTFTNKDDIILDFFSGSATTAHATMQLNSDDGGNRQFIMVQLPEKLKEKDVAYKDGYKTITEIAEERIRRAGDKIVEETGNNDLDIGFKVFRLDKSNIKEWGPDEDNLEQTLDGLRVNIKEGRTSEDLIYEIILKYGLDLTTPIEKIDEIYSIGAGEILITLIDEFTPEIMGKVIELIDEFDTTRVIFKDSAFKKDHDKTNLKENLRAHKIEEFITI